MANVDNPNGFRPVRHLSNSCIATEDFTIDAGAAAIGNGSLVRMTGTGRDVALAAPAESLIGVFAGVKYTLPSGEFVYRKDWPGPTTLKAGTEAIALVYADPDIVYEAQHDGTPVEGNIGNLFDCTAESVNALGKSTQEIDTSTNATGVQLKTLRLISTPDNELGEFARQEVIIASRQHFVAS